MKPESPPLRIAMLASDSREMLKQYAWTAPEFGTAIEALLQGFPELPGVEVHVLSCLQQQVTSPEKLAPNVWHHPLLVPKRGWLRTGYQGCIRAVRRKLRQLQPDIVHGQGTERDCAISAALSGFPNVVTIHGNMAELARLFGARVLSFNWCMARLESFTLRRTCGVFCNSAYTESLVRPRARKVWRVPNAVRAPFFADRPDVSTKRRPVLVNIGVVSPRKRQVEMLQQARTWQERGLVFQMQFVGPVPDDNYGRRFRELLTLAEQAGYARHLGVKPPKELIQVLDEAGALIHFPSEEAFGLVVAEALARGLKLFGTRVGGITEIAAGVPEVELFELEDWTGLGQAVFQWVRAGCPAASGVSESIREHYAPLAVARRHLEIYREVLGRT